MATNRENSENLPPMEQDNNNGDMDDSNGLEDIPLPEFTIAAPPSIPPKPRLPQLLNLTADLPKKLALPTPKSRKKQAVEAYAPFKEVATALNDQIVKSNAKIKTQVQEYNQVRNTASQELTKAWEKMNKLHDTVISKTASLVKLQNEKALLEVQHKTATQSLAFMTNSRNKAQEAYQKAQSTLKVQAKTIKELEADLVKEQQKVMELSNKVSSADDATVATTVVTPA